MGVVLLHTALGILHTHRRRGKSRCLLHTDVFFCNKNKNKNKNSFFRMVFCTQKKNQFFHVQNTLVGFVAHNF